MLFNNNSKCIVVLLLAIALICMLNQTEKPVEAMTQEENAVESPEIDSDVDSDNLLSEVLADVEPSDDTQSTSASVNENSTSVTAKNMAKLMEENEEKKLKFNASDLLPKDVNQDWFETDFSSAQVNVDDNNLVVTDRYIVGVNTVGQSLKNASYDLRAAPANPKFTVSPWQQSTIEPDFNLKNMME
jgi:hypothetical protein